MGMSGRHGPRKYREYYRHPAQTTPASQFSEWLGQVMRKCVLCHMRTTKVQISLRIRAVWSAPLLFATKYDMYTCSTQSFKILVSVAEQTGLNLA